MGPEILRRLDFVHSSISGFFSLEGRYVFLVVEGLGEDVLFKLWEPFLDPADDLTFDDVVADSQCF